jgi:hypothetical protein
MQDVTGDKYMYLAYCVRLVGIKELINHNEFSGSPKGKNVRLSVSIYLTVGKSQGYRKRNNKGVLSPGL